MNKIKQAAIGAALIVIAAAGLAVGGVRPALGGGEKITICHAAGLAGTTHYITLTISRNAVFGPGGHFFENGTPRAGHEQDYMGACRDDTTTTTTTTTPSTTETTTTTGPPPPPPPCPNGEDPIHGQDGNPGNDNCNPCDAPVNLEKCPPPPTTTTTTTEPPPTTTSPPTETTSPPETTTTVTPTTAEPSSPPAQPTVPRGSVKPKPKPHAKPKPPPACPPGQPFNGKCGVQGSG